MVVVACNCTDAGPDPCTVCPDLCPYILTFGPGACGVSILSTGANLPLAQVVVVTSCNLRCLPTELPNLCTSSLFSGLGRSGEVCDSGANWVRSDYICTSIPHTLHL